MESLIILSQIQSVENAVSENVYFGSHLIAVRLTAAEGYELIKEGDEPNGTKAVDIPASYKDKINSYKAIIKVAKTEEPEPKMPEEIEEATEQDFKK